MRIGIDARELSGRATGVGRILSGLLAEWSTGPYANAHEFVLYTPEPPAAAPAGDRFTVRVVPGAGGTWWEQVTLVAAARGDRLDVWYSPAYTAPLRMHVPTAVLVHDVSFVVHPEWFRTREGARRRFFCRQAAHRARAVITVSEFSRREIVRWLGIPAERIHVVPPGVEARGGLEPSGASPCSVLFVGSIFNRRHVVDLIRAFAPIARRRPDASLDIVGDDRSFPPEDLPAAIAAEGLGQQIRWHRYVTDDELAGLYARARAFAFLSEYEGLGLTPLEALAGGIPPVLLETPVARESCGDAALYVAPGDLAAGDLTSATAALELALFSEAARSRVLGAAPAALAKFQWARAARETAAVIEGCGRR